MTAPAPVSTIPQIAPAALVRTLLLNSWRPAISTTDDIIAMSEAPKNPPA